MAMDKGKKCPSLFKTLLFVIALSIGILGGHFYFTNKMWITSTNNESYYEERKLFEKQANEIYEYIGVRFKPSFVKQEYHDGSKSNNTSTKPIYRIPNLFHYIFLTKDGSPLEFTEYISILSVYKYQNPDQIWLHCQHDPFGYWWDELMQNISWHKLRVVHLEALPSIGNSALTNPEHVLEMTKIRILTKFGGVYLDSDVILIQSLDPLRLYSSVVGQESDMKISPAILMSEANSTYLQLLQKSFFHDFKPNHQDYNNGILPYKIAVQNPDIVYIESSSLVAPSLAKKYLLYTDKTELLDWRNLYAIHLMFHKGVNRVYNPTYIIPLKNLIGHLLRRVYYGSDADLDPYLEYVKDREKYIMNKGP